MSTTETILVVLAVTYFVFAIRGAIKGEWFLLLCLATGIAGFVIASKYDSSEPVLMVAGAVICFGSLYYGCQVFAITIIGVVFEFLSPPKAELKNYEWYTKNFPEFVINKKVRCHQCESGSIGVERVKNGTYLRRHYCRNCGESLYYSEEI